MSINFLITTYLFASVLVVSDSNGQHKSIKDVNISLDFNGVSVKSALEGIEAKTEFKFVYSEETIKSTFNKPVSFKVENQSVAEALKIIANKTGLSFHQVDANIIVNLTPPKAIDTKLPEEEPLLNKVVTGKVTDENGEPLVGVNVLIKGKTEGTVTDIDGNYRLSVPDDDNILIFSFIGYVRQEIAINARAIIDVSLTPDITTLGEVIVSTGYWQTEERLNPGNIAKVTAKEIEAQPVTTPLQALSGRVAGVVIRQRSGVPGAGIDIQIRGQNSLRREGNDPLYVVDGVPYPSTTLASLGSEVFLSPVQIINNLNPSDIESIEILKDADATAIYGSRGANGVVLITTKKGNSGKTSIEVNHYTGIGEITNKTNLLNTQQHRDMIIEALANDGFDPIPPFFEPIFPSLFVWDSTRYTDSQDELIGGTANYSNTRFSITGGNNHTRFLLSGTYFKQTTVYPGDFALQRGSGLFNLNHKSSDEKFTTNLSLNYIAEKNDLPRDEFTSKALQLAPNAPEFFDEEGNLNFEDNTFNTNPFAEILRTYLSQTRNLIANATLGYEIISDLRLKANLGYHNIVIDEIRTIPISSINPAFDPTGSSTFADGNSETWVIEPQAEYQKEIGEGELTILIGATFQQTTNEQQTTASWGYTSDALLENINAAPNVDISDAIFTEYNYNAIFGRVNYNWKKKYILNLTGRRDGSSRFGPGKRFSNFGAIGAGWIFSNEKFIQNSLPFLSFGKLRVSYGTTGSDQIGNYEFLDTHKATDFSLLGTSGLIPTRLVNPDFGWETNKKLEGGIEVGIANDRVLITTSHYRNRSSSQLIGIPLAGTTGFSSVRANFPATVENRGWEFELNTTNIKTNSFEWSTSVNLTIPRNELVEFRDIESSSFADIYTVGESLFNRKRYRYTGVDSETGLYTFEDLNEDGQISSDDLQSVKEVAQNYFGGLQNRISYKGFELSFLFQFVQQTGLNYRNSFPNPGAFFSNHPVQILNRWRRPGDITDIQRYSAGFDPDANNAYSNSLLSTYIISDASFIRLQNVFLSYNFPQTFIKRLKLQNLRIFVQGQNLLTITDYEGLDPETQTSNSLPPLRVLTGGFNVKF